MARSGWSPVCQRSPATAFAAKSSATESTCMDKSPLSLGMTATSYSECNASTADVRARTPSEETTGSPRFPQLSSRLQESEARSWRLPEAPQVLQGAISGRGATYSELDACSLTPSSISCEAMRAALPRDPRGSHTHELLAQGVISEPTPAAQIPRPSLSLIESDLEKLYAAARAPHAWHYPTQDLRSLACHQDDREPVCASVMQRCPYCQRLPEIPTEAPARGPMITPPAAHEEDLWSLSLSEAGQDSSSPLLYSSLKPQQGSLLQTDPSSTAARRSRHGAASTSRQRQDEHYLGQPYPRSLRRDSEQDPGASCGSQSSSHRSQRPMPGPLHVPERSQSTPLRAQDVATPRLDFERVAGTRSSQAVEQSRIAKTRVDRPSSYGDAWSEAVKPAGLDIGKALPVQEEASGHGHERLPPPPERWLEAQSFAEPGRQLRRLARRRRSLAGELRSRLHHMEQHCGLLSEDYRRLAGLDSELHRVVATLQNAFATEHKALALSVSSCDGPPAIA